MKKIISILILLVLSVTLYSCIEAGEFIPYEPKTDYESTLISSSEYIKEINIVIFDSSSYQHENKTVENKTQVGSGVVIKKTRDGSVYNYQALTTANVVNKVTNDLKVSYRGFTKTVDAEVLVVNDASNYSIISFATRDNIKEAKVFNNNKYYEPKVGDTIISNNTDQGRVSVNNISHGFISYADEYMFTHNLSVNKGSEGSGIFNSEGYLIGLNNNKIYHYDDILSDYNVLGITNSVNINNFIDELKTILDVKETENKTINNENELDKAINKVYEDNNKYIVKVLTDDYMYSGLLIDKQNDEYFVLTSFIDKNEESKVIVNDKEYDLDIISSDSKSLTSVLKFTTTDVIEVYPYNPLDKNTYTNNQRGSFLVTIGSVTNDSPNSIVVGNLSDDDDEFDFRFMHSSKTNLGQLGAPIFNLNGDLIGLNLDKINNILTSTGVIIAEGLSYGYKIDYLMKEYSENDNLTSTNYISDITHEKELIDTVNSVISTVVTVKSTGRESGYSGHGSGTIYKKEKTNQGYLYYVLTNAHVVEPLVRKNNNDYAVKSTEIVITFNDGNKSVRSKDYFAKHSHDYAIVRFESEEELSVINSKVFTSNSNVSFNLGQTVIAIGSPENSNRKGYVTVGNLSELTHIYDGVINLGIKHTAPLNPGNSGGSLFSLSGDFIGVNVAKQPSVGGLFSEGLGISLNVNVVRNNINSAFTNVSYSKLEEHQPRIGIKVQDYVYDDYVSNLRDNVNPYFLTSLYPKFIVDQLPESSYGVLVIEVDDLFQSYDILKTYDVIIDIDGTKIINTDSIPPILANKTVDDIMEFTILRKGYEDPLKVSVRIS